MTLPKRLTVVTPLALLTAVTLRPNTDHLSHLEPLPRVLTHPDDLADDLVPYDLRPLGAHVVPPSRDCVDVGPADARVEDLDLDVVLAERLGLVRDELEVALDGLVVHSSPADELGVGGGRVLGNGHVDYNDVVVNEV